MDEIADSEKNIKFELARMMFDDMQSHSPCTHPTIYKSIERHIGRENIFECLGISKEEYTQRRHAAFVNRGLEVLKKIRNDEVGYIEDLVNDVVDNEYILAEIDLSQDEFKRYAGILALALVSKTVRNLNHSWTRISAVMKTAGISDKDTFYAEIIEAAKNIPALSTFI